MGLKGPDPSKGKMYIPGPGAYAPDFSTLKEHHPSFKIGTEERIPKDRTTIKEVPGPGNYNPKKRPPSAAPAYGFGSSTRSHGSLGEREKTPGPGAYKLPSRIQDVPDFLLPNRSTEFRYV